MGTTSSAAKNTAAFDGSDSSSAQSAQLRDQLRSVLDILPPELVTIVVEYSIEYELISGGKDGQIRLWRGDVCHSVLRGHEDAVRAIILLPNRRIASASGDETIRIWNLKTNACESTLAGGHAAAISCLAVAEDGTLLSGGDDSAIRVWFPSPQYELRRRSAAAPAGADASTLAGHTGGIRCISFIADAGGSGIGRSSGGESSQPLRAVTAAADGWIVIWDIRSGKAERRIRVADGHVYCMTALPDSDTGVSRIAVGGSFGFVRVYELGKPPAAGTTSGGGSEVVESLATQHMIAALPVHTLSSVIALPPAAAAAASAASTATAAAGTSSGGDAKSSLVVSGSGGRVPRIACAAWDKTIQIWSINGTRPDAPLIGHALTVQAIVLLSDGRIATGSHDTTIKVWDIGTRECLMTLTGHSGPVLSLLAVPL